MGQSNRLLGKFLPESAMPPRRPNPPPSTLLDHGDLEGGLVRMMNRFRDEGTIFRWVTGTVAEGLALASREEAPRPAGEEARPEGYGAPSGSGAAGRVAQALADYAGRASTAARRLRTQRS